MAGLTDAGKAVMLTALGAAAVYISLHTADPGTGGGSEVVGGSPAYAREPVTWAAVVGGALDSSSTPVFNIPAGTTLTHFGLWSAVTGGTFYGGDALASSAYFSAQGTYTILTAAAGL